MEFELQKNVKLAYKSPVKVCAFDNKDALKKIKYAVK